MIIIDASHQLNRGVFANKNAILEDVEYTAHVILNMILNVSERFGASKTNSLVIAMDSRPSWRHYFYVRNSKDFPEYEGKTYKGDRNKDSDIPWDEIHSIDAVLMEGLQKHSDFHVVRVRGAEADDIIAVLAKDCLRRKEVCWIISSDKDFRQLQDTTYVHLFDPVTYAFIPPIDVEEYKKLHIMVAGDDNIKNIAPRLGKKTAIKLLPRLEEELAINPEMRKRFEFNRTLIDFNYIPEQLCQLIMEAWKKEEHNYNAPQLVSLLQKYKLSRVYDRMSQFKLPVGGRDTKLNSMHKNSQQISQELNAFFA